MTLFRRRRRRAADERTAHDLRDQAATLAVSGLAGELRAAADALESAAFVLRDQAGLGRAAGTAMQAARRARAAADEIA